MCCPVFCNPFAFNPFGFGLFPAMPFTPYIPFSRSSTFSNPAMGPWEVGRNQVLGNLSFSQPNIGAYAQAGYEQGVMLGNAIRDKVALETKAQGIATNINALISDIQTSLSSDKVKSEQKAKLEKLQKDLKNLLEQMKQVKGDNIDGQLNAIQEAYNGIKLEVEKIAQEIQAQIEVTTPETTTPEATTPETTTPENTTPENTTPENTTPETPVKSKGNPNSPDASEVRAWARALHDAGEGGLFGWGTDDQTFETLISNLSKDNVVECIDQFTNTYGDFGLFVGKEAEHYQKKRVFGHIVDVLQDRAEQAGCLDKIAEYVANINKELDECNISKHHINDNIKAIVEIIKQAEQES